MYAGAASGLVSSSSFENNVSGSRGGAIAVVQLAKPTLVHVRLTKNSANAGGGISVEANSCVVAVGLTLISNHALTNGGGMLVSGDANVTCASFGASENSALFSGGAVYCGKYGLLHLDDGTVSNNNAAEGAGICLATLSPAIVANTDILSNNADSRGGGVMCANGASHLSAPLHTFYNTTFSLNLAKTGGAITALTNTGVILQHCDLQLNQAVDGAGVMVADAASLVANHTRFS